ncbi:pyridoxamine 5'-phosphate oxidase [Pukyongia salina]|uniref:Pyridoxamine 5'-phosphate oxidase n=1 Tax=Pukyongia salina TaxID=2094025 RepID=A0A2S0HV75_9FLAO|nr:pyridoxal 5'-phosphate synthase [Pukyongia salina]AVI50516.1 pyridoxamine 5'-phosphate oxidase [Pukyongia salina]
MKDISHLPEQPDPFVVFTNWFHEHSTHTKSAHPGACVLSTNGLDGFPNARFLSLKLIEVPFLIFGGTRESLKAKEISNDPHAALTFWWEESKRQVRVQGIAATTSDEHSDFLFRRRDKAAQLVSTISQQGAHLNSWEDLKDQFDAALASRYNESIARPENWCGFKVEPTRFEFMEFMDTRLHRRTLFSKKNNEWVVKMVQP